MIVLPLFNGLVRVLPAIEPLVNQVQNNYEMWLEADAAMAVMENHQG